MEPSDIQPVDGSAVFMEHPPNPITDAAFRSAVLEALKAKEDEDGNDAVR